MAWATIEIPDEGKMMKQRTLIQIKTINPKGTSMIQDERIVEEDVKMLKTMCAALSKETGIQHTWAWYI